MFNSSLFYHFNAIIRLLLNTDWVQYTDVDQYSVLYTLPTNIPLKEVEYW